MGGRRIDRAVRRDPVDPAESLGADKINYVAGCGYGFG